MTGLLTTNGKFVIHGNISTKESFVNEFFIAFAILILCPGIG